MWTKQGGLLGDFEGGNLLSSFRTRNADGMSSTRHVSLKGLTRNIYYEQMEQWILYNSNEGYMCGPLFFSTMSTVSSCQAGANGKSQWSHCVYRIPFFLKCISKCRRLCISQSHISTCDAALLHSKSRAVHQSEKHARLYETSWQVKD